MKYLSFFLSFCLHQTTICNDKVYILFSSDYPKSYFRMEPTTREKNMLGTFFLDKTSGDCPTNCFWYYKYSSEQSIINVKLDTLKNVITSEWVATQPDTTLIKLFRGKNIYVIPKDSLKNSRGKAYLTTYKPCEKI